MVFRRYRKRHVPKTRTATYRRRSYRTKRSYQKYKKYPRYRQVSTIAPNTFNTKLKYMDFFNMATGGAAAYQTVPFRMNGVYDPVFGVGGGTCTGYPQLAAIYGKYTVLASKITINAYSTCASPIIVSVFARSSQGAAPASAIEVQQKSFEYNKSVRAKQLVPFTSGNGYPRTFLKFYKSIRSVEGRRIWGENDYTSSTISTPLLNTIWDVNLCSLDAAAVSSTANYTIKITYYVRFSEMTVATTD